MLDLQTTDEEITGQPPFLERPGWVQPALSQGWRASRAQTNSQVKTKWCISRGTSITRLLVSTRKDGVRSGLTCIG